MPKTAIKKPIRVTGKRKRLTMKSNAAKAFDPNLTREARTGKSLEISQRRFDAVMKAAERSGLMGEKSGRIGGRVSPALVEQAKKLTGIESDTDLLEFALANVALKDDFPEAFRKLRGTVDSTLDLEF